MSSNQKVICAALLFAAWGGFVAAGMTPVEPLISSIHEALFALGVFAAALANPKE